MGDNDRTAEPARPRRLGLVVALVLLSGFAWLVLRPHEPVFEGQPLSATLGQIEIARRGFLGLPNPFKAEAAQKRAERAIRALGPRALPVLVKMAGTRVLGVRMVVGELATVPELAFLHLPPQLGKHDTAVWGFRLLAEEAQPAVPALSRLLGDKDAEVRATAARCLAVITPRAAAGVPMMIRLLGDRDPQVRAAGADCLAQIGPAAAEAVPALVQVLRDRRGMATNQWLVTHASEEAARALGDIGPAAKAAVPALEEMTHDPAPDTSEAVAAVALIKINQGPWRPFFDRLKDPSDAKRWARTAYQVGRLGAQAGPAIPLLLAGLAQTNGRIQLAAAGAIGGLHRRPDLCLGPMVSRLGSTNGVRERVLMALGEFGPEARPVAREVARCLSDQNPGLRELATNTLRRIDPDAPELKPKRR